jgi:hypothetical protein
MGFVIPTFFLGEEDQTDIEKGKQDFAFYLFVENTFITLFCGPILFLAKDRPPTPPS